MSKMSETDFIDSVACEMVSDVYEVLKQDHDEAIDDGLTEAGANEAVRQAIEKLYNVMKEVDNGN